MAEGRRGDEGPAEGRRRAACPNAGRLAVHEQADGLAVVGHGEVVPVAVADVDSGDDLGGSHAGRVGAEEPGAGAGADLPVEGRLLGVGGDEDVEAAFGAQPETRAWT